MSNNLPEQWQTETQLGQILLSTGAIHGPNAEQRVQAVADEQAKDAAAHGGKPSKKIGEMLVDAHLCNPSDVAAGLEVQREVRTDLEDRLDKNPKLRENPEQLSDADLKTMMNHAFLSYAITHPEYDVPGGTRLEIPPNIQEAKPRTSSLNELFSVDRLCQDSAGKTPALVESTDRHRPIR